MIADGVVVPRSRPAYYVYGIDTGEHLAVGIVAEVDVSDYPGGRVRRHELTRSATEDLLVDHLTRVGAHSDPVALTYRADPEIEAIVTEVRSGPAVLDFSGADGTHQKVWVVDDPDTMARLDARLGLIEDLYVTDGHHRCAAAARYSHLMRAANGPSTGDEAYNYVLSTLYPDTTLTVLEINRCVADVAVPLEDLVEALGRRFDLAELPAGVDPRPAAVGSFGMLAQGRAFRITVPPSLVPDDVYAGLDVVLLQDLVLGPLLGIDDPRTDRRLRYVPGPEVPDPGAHGCDVCFLVHPTPVADVMRIADAGLVMPPKSTWFEPKVRGGLFVRLLDAAD